MGSPLPAPKNWFIDLAQIVIDKLVEGVGVDLTVAAAVSAQPWLASPFVNYIFTWIVSQFAKVIDENLFKIAIKLIIRAQSDSRKQDFNDSVKPIIDGSPTDAEIQAARDTADRLIERNRP